MDKITGKTLRVLYQLHRLDLVLFQWTMQRRRLELLTRLARGISHTADGFGYPALAVVLYLAGVPSAGALIQVGILAFALERPLYWILKNGLRRNRPSAILPDFRSAIIPSDQFSFPSGHTSGAFVMATLLMLFFPPLAPLAYSWAVLVGASRVTLGVHFPTDTLAGALMGSSLAFFSFYWMM